MPIKVTIVLRMTGREKDINGLIKVFQVPLNGAKTVSQLICGPVQLFFGGPSLL